MCRQILKGWMISSRYFISQLNFKKCMSMTRSFSIQANVSLPELAERGEFLKMAPIHTLVRLRNREKKRRESKTEREKIKNEKKLPLERDLILK